MGKNKQKPQRLGRRAHYSAEVEEDTLPSSAFDLSVSSPPTETLDHLSLSSEEEELAAQDASNGHYHHGSEGLSKFDLYQISVQSPMGDISYLQKFFLTYVGGRSPVHLREDFCGTALICAEWLKGGLQRLATGLDLDMEALMWGLQNNFERFGGSTCCRVRLLHGNVLHSLSSAKLVSSSAYMPDDRGLPEAVCAASVSSDEGYEGTIAACTKDHQHRGINATAGKFSEDFRVTNSNPNANLNNAWPSVDIICAFNYSCCCLHKRTDLVMYLKHARGALSAKGGIFAMDLYGGVSSEAPLKLRRHFPNFTYVWEQEAFDVVQRMTKISLHFQLKNRKMLRHAFTYNWRLWSLPEVADCLEEAGFDCVRVWLREMPSLEEREGNDDFWNGDSIYEETTAFYQQSAWNAYVVAIAFPEQNTEF